MTQLYCIYDPEGKALNKTISSVKALSWGQLNCGVFIFKEALATFIERKESEGYSVTCNQFLIYNTDKVNE